MNFQVGQRYHYYDAMQDLILEVVHTPQNHQGWCTCIALHGVNLAGRSTNFSETWDTDFGNWEYLTGQDKPLA